MFRSTRNACGTLPDVVERVRKGTRDSIAKSQAAATVIEFSTIACSISSRPRCQSSL